MIEIKKLKPEGIEAALVKARQYRLLNEPRAAESISGITGIEVTNMSARISDGRISQYRASLKLAFAVK